MIKKQPKVSVIVPIYGVEKYIHQAIDSILNQTLTDIEIILVDDGSPDKCPQIIDEYAKKDKRIKVIHKENGGYGQTCNIGLKQAVGEYIAIMEPDDFIKPKMYEDLYNIAIKNDADIVKSPFVTNMETKQKMVYQHFVDNNITRNTFKIEEYPTLLEQHPSIWSCIYKRKFLEENNIMFIEAPGAGWTDNLFFIQTMCLARRINLSFENYYYWRFLEETSSDALKDYRIPFDRLNEIYDWLEGKNIKSDIIWLYVYKRTMCYIGIVLKMKKIKSIVDCKNRIHNILGRVKLERLVVANKKDFKKEIEKYFHHTWYCIIRVYYIRKLKNLLSKKGK